MSETTPERPARGPQPARAASPSGGTGFARKIGPLPVWGWVGLAALGGGAYLWWRNHHKATSATTSTAVSTSTGATTSTDYAGEVSTLQAEIQQLQGAALTPATTTTTQGTSGHKAVTASGKESLNKIAAANGSSAAAIAEYTLANKKNISATLRKYLTSGNYQARIPKGLVFWVPTTSTSSGGTA